MLHDYTKDAAIQALRAPKIEVKPNEYFIPEPNTCVLCLNGENDYALLVKKDEKLGLVGWLIDLTKGEFNEGYLFAEGAKERFCKAEESEILSSHRGKVKLTDNIASMARESMLS